MKYKKEDEIKMIKYFRFRNTDPQTTKYTYMPIVSIAKFLNKSVAYVSTICKKLSQ